MQPLADEWVIDALVGSPPEMVGVMLSARRFAEYGSSETILIGQISGELRLVFPR